METHERFFALSLRIWYVVLDRVPTVGAAVFEREIMTAFNRE